MYTTGHLENMKIPKWIKYRSLWSNYQKQTVYDVWIFFNMHIFFKKTEIIFSIPIYNLLFQI